MMETQSEIKTKKFGKRFHERESSN